jgi:biopolymer transport protein ExbD
MATASNDGEFGLQIAPMLDVLFVLLLFFMVSAGMQKHEAALTTQLPGRGASPGPLIPIQLEITADGQVMFNEVPTDTPADHQLTQTSTRLKAALAQTPDRPVIISPEASTRHQRIVDVLDVCQAAKVKNLAFNPISD